MNESKRIPAHVAIIMDGNGRWAEKHGKPRYEGHIEGVKSVKACIKAAARNGVRYLTLYAFSGENWGRPAEEVDALMGLFCQCVTEQTPELIEERVRVRLIGRRDRFSEQVNAHLERIERETAGGDRLTLILAFDYSSREEIARAARVLAERAAAGEIRPEDISEKEKGFLKQVLLEKGDKVSPAGRQIIMRGSGTENLLFYEKNRESLRESQVYLNIETIYPDGAMPREVNVFSISESIARIYWKRYPVFPCRGEDKTKKLEIGLIGFDNLGQNLLSYGLLQNIYSEKQTIIYHIWGAGDRRFLHLHRIFQEWQKDTVFPDGTGDRVIFHGEDWDSPQGLSGICQLNRLILCQDHGNDKLLTRLMFLLSAGEVWTIGEKEPGIHVKFGCGESCGLAEEMKGAVQFFGRYEETVTKENIIQEALLKEAKMLHWQYEKRKNGVANNTALSNDSLQAAEQAWKSLPRFFDRYSNIAAADYKTVLKRLLQEHERAEGVVTDEDKAGLAALEHIRWCRFHWWNNWTLDASLHQKAENERKHPWLRPYGSLPKEIQQYDLDRVNECLEELDRDHQNNEM